MPILIRVLYDTGICLGYGCIALGLFCQFCLPAEIMLLEIICKDDVWLNVGWGFFVFCMLKFSGFHRNIYCVDASLGLIYYKNLSLRRDNCVCEVLELHNVYTSTLFVDHHPSNLPTLEDITTFHLCKFYWPGQKAKWICHLTNNTVPFLHAI